MKHHPTLLKTHKKWLQLCRRNAVAWRRKVRRQARQAAKASDEGSRS